MRKIKTFLFSALGALFLASCSSGSDDESPVVEPDSFLLPKSVKVYEGENVVEANLVQTYSYSYDGNKLIQVVNSDLESGYKRMFKFSYLGDKINSFEQTESYPGGVDNSNYNVIYNEKNQMTEINHTSNNIKFIYSYDTQGKNNITKFYGSIPIELIQVNNYTYDSKGNSTLEEVVDHDDSGAKNYYRYTHDDKAYNPFKNFNIKNHLNDEGFFPQFIGHVTSTNCVSKKEGKSEEDLDFYETLKVINTDLYKGYPKKMILKTNDGETYTLVIEYTN